MPPEGMEVFSSVVFAFGMAAFMSLTDNYMVKTLNSRRQTRHLQFLTTKLITNSIVGLE